MHHVIAFVLFLFSFIFMSNCMTDDSRSKNYVVPSTRQSTELTLQGNTSTSKWDQFKIYDQSLNKILENIIANCDLGSCLFSIAYQKSFTDSVSLESLTKLTIKKQLVLLDSEAAFKDLMWEKSSCTIYFFFLDTFRDFQNYIKNSFNEWNNMGKFIFIVPNVEFLNDVIKSLNGRQTQYITALVPSKSPPKWLTYENQLFPEPKMAFKIINTAFDKNFFSDELHDFKQVNLTLATFEWQPNIFYERDYEGNVISYYGIDIEVVKTLSSVLNFGIIYKEPPFLNEFFGSDIGNGTWNGLVGMVSNRKADIAVADVFFTRGRAKVVDFAGPFAVESTCFMARKAQPLPRWQSLLLPFQLHTWIALLCFMIVVVLFMYIFINVFAWIKNETVQHSTTFYFIPFYSHFKQPRFIKFRNTSTRVFLIAVWIYCLIITTAYSSNLTAFLTVRRLPKSFETIKELRESGLSLGGVGPAFDAVSNSEGNEDLTILATRFVSYEDMENLMNSVLNGESVMLLNRLFLEYASIIPVVEGQENPRTTLRILKECFQSFATGMYLQKNSPYVNKFNEVIGRMVNGGLTDKWFYDSIAEANYKRIEKDKMNEKGTAIHSTQGEQTTVVISLTLDHLQGIFFIWFVGLVLSVLVFIGEVLKEKKCSKY